MVRQETKKQKMVQDKVWATSVESIEDPSVVEVRQQHHTWASQLELDEATIPWNSSIREFQIGHSTYIVEALEQPLLLPKDMAALRHMRQPNLFISLKKDLAMVGSLRFLFVLL